MNLNKLEAELASLLYDAAVEAAGHLGDDQADALDNWLGEHIPGAVAITVAVVEKQAKYLAAEVADMVADEPRIYPGQEEL